MPRFLPFAAAAAVAASSAILSVPVASHAAVADGSTARAATQFAMRASGYGTRLDGGQLPAGSGTTAYQIIGCTNKAPITRRNEVAAVTIPGLGTAEGVRTRNSTSTDAKTGTTTVVTTHDIARLELGDRLVLRGLSSVARAWHDAKGFHREVTNSIGSITLAGNEQALPMPGRPLAIPGLATIFFGRSAGFANSHGAKAVGHVLRIRVEPTGTLFRVAHTNAEIHRGLEVGRFRGQAYGTQVDALQQNVRSGPQPLSYLPCQGTAGKVREKAVASVDLAGEIVVGAVENEVLGHTVGTGAKRRATGYTQSRIARISLGPLTISAIKGRANVTRFRNGRLVRSAAGTTIGSITVDGEERAIPDPGQALEIPGLLMLRANVVEKVKNGIKVTAVRIKLLDGSGATINLGNARMEIKPSGFRG